MRTQMHEGWINNKEMAGKARLSITPQTQIFSYSQWIFVSHIRAKHCRFLWFMPLLGIRCPCEDASKQEYYFIIDFDLQCPVHQKFLVQLARINVGRRCLLAYNILSRFEDNVMLTLIRQLFFWVFLTSTLCLRNTVASVNAIGLKVD